MKSPDCEDYHCETCEVEWCSCWCHPEPEPDDYEVMEMLEDTYEWDYLHDFLASFPQYWQYHVGWLV